ncbi:unnamed protein product [Amoebophrya sp. A25]|nr:unnamed protein product [Amoebophrya sp. A25]|eukprot:GSA25T00017486001.1
MGMGTKSTNLSRGRSARGSSPLDGAGASRSNSSSLFLDAGAAAGGGSGMMTDSWAAPGSCRAGENSFFTAASPIEDLQRNSFRLVSTSAAISAVYPSRDASTIAEIAEVHEDAVELAVDVREEQAQKNSTLLVPSSTPSLVRRSSNSRRGHICSSSRHGSARRDRKPHHDVAHGSPDRTFRPIRENPEREQEAAALVREMLEVHQKRDGPHLALSLDGRTSALHTPTSATTTFGSSSTTTTCAPPGGGRGVIGRCSGGLLGLGTTTVRRAASQNVSSGGRVVGTKRVMSAVPQGKRALQDSSHPGAAAKEMSTSLTHSSSTTTTCNNPSFSPLLNVAGSASAFQKSVPEKALEEQPKQRRLPSSGMLGIFSAGGTSTGSSRNFFGGLHSPSKLFSHVFQRQPISLGYARRQEQHAPPPPYSMQFASLSSSLLQVSAQDREQQSTSFMSNVGGAGAGACATSLPHPTAPALSLLPPPVFRTTPGGPIQNIATTACTNSSVASPTAIAVADARVLVNLSSTSQSLLAANVAQQIRPLPPIMQSPLLAGRGLGIKINPGDNSGAKRHPVARSLALPVAPFPRASNLENQRVALVESRGLSHVVSVSHLACAANTTTLSGQGNTLLSSHHNNYEEPSDNIPVPAAMHDLDHVRMEEREAHQRVVPLPGKNNPEDTGLREPNSTTDQRHQQAATTSQVRGATPALQRKLSRQLAQQRLGSASRTSGGTPLMESRHRSTTPGPSTTINSAHLQPSKKNMKEHSSTTNRNHVIAVGPNGEEIQVNIPPVNPGASPERPPRPALRHANGNLVADSVPRYRRYGTDSQQHGGTGAPLELFPAFSGFNALHPARAPLLLPAFRGKQ